MGRRPKPATVKLATGNPGRRPIPKVKSAEGTGPAVKPKHVEGNVAASALWDEYSPALCVLGTLTKASEPLFARWCRLEAEFREQRPSEWTAAMIGKIGDLESRLGMDPSALGKFSTPKADEGTDPAEEFFTGPRAVG